VRVVANAVATASVGARARQASTASRRPPQRLRCDKRRRFTLQTSSDD
jgi:hypothetical protein